VRKRLGVSYSDLVRIAGKTGNSLAAINKEVELERAQSNPNQGSAVAPNVEPTAGPTAI
jgi:hypothetical protein